MLIQKIIDQIINRMTGQVLENTVDMVKQGDSQQECTGITVTFLATMEVLKKAVENGHSLVITHEPVFYTNLDKTDWLEDHPVYQAKRDYIQQHKLVVWRCHDYIHRMKPDGIDTGILQQLGWTDFADQDHPNLYHLPKCKIGDIVDHIKKVFDLSVLKIVGNPDMECSKVALMVGACGGVNHMNNTRDLDPDLFICGEAAEWETNIYYQDLNVIGQNKALIVMGHQPSEEAGMAYCAKWLKKLFPDLDITHQPSGLGYKYI
jgi:putative NIF3 family GTP cyclohydrolase 1 type 2